MATSIELKKRELAELKKKSDKLKAEIKADDEKHGRKLSLACVELIPADSQVIFYANGRAVTGFIAKSEIARLKRFVGILAERYGV